MKSINPLNNKDASKIIIETSLNLIEQLNIEDSKLSSYLIGYIGLNRDQAVAQWLIDNWYFETTVNQNEYIYEITQELTTQLKNNAKKLYLPWMADQW
ncbi:MAG: hypothetical protein HRU38_08585 [Saccharospirillaceae bacterium]|nr:hypothetical protein [Pseudomonadales bacterium]NRB78710.1 hypothetical protein [Saccharospirillaceae bacterium]